MKFRGTMLRAKWGRIAASFGLVAMLSVTEGGGGVYGSNARPADLADIMQDRSPGERRSAELRQSKKFSAVQPKAGGSAAPLRSARALPRTGRAAPATPSRSIEVVESPFVTEAQPLGTVFASLGDAVPVIPGTVPGIGGGIIPIPGGGGGGVVTPPVAGPAPGDGGTTPIVPSVPAVPEPATWLNMLLGFAAIGSLMRRTRSNGVRVAKGWRWRTAVGQA